MVTAAASFTREPHRYVVHVAAQPPVLGVSTDTAAMSEPTASTAIKAIATVLHTSYFNAYSTNSSISARMIITKSQSAGKRNEEAW